MIVSVEDTSTLHIAPEREGFALRPSKESDLVAYAVVIDEVSGGEIANILRGYLLVGDEKIRFMGIAYGRYGGQNVAPRFSPHSKKRIREVFGNLEVFEQDLQMKLVRGDFELQPRTGRRREDQGKAGEA